MAVTSVQAGMLVSHIHGGFGGGHGDIEKKLRVAGEIIDERSQVCRRGSTDQMRQQGLHQERRRSHVALMHLVSHHQGLRHEHP